MQRQGRGVDRREEKIERKNRRVGRKKNRRKIEGRVGYNYRKGYYAVVTKEIALNILIMIFKID